MSQTTLLVLTTISNWVIAIANVTLFIIGFWTLRNDRRRIVKMEQTEQLKYAENVYAWIEERSSKNVTVYCRNGSPSVIYNVQVVILDSSNNIIGNTYEIELMKPLEEKNFLVEHTQGIKVESVNITFRDPRGLCWSRQGDGRLYEYLESSLLLGQSNPIIKEQRQQLQFPLESKRRSLVKTVIWRVIGIIWTWIGAWAILVLVPPKYSSATVIATLIVLYHHSTRTFLYYFYERIWLHIKWGRRLEDLPPMTRKEKVLWSVGILIAVFLTLYVLMYVSPIIEGKKS